MEIRQLEYFKAICEELHFTRAAEKLGVTQPTLSHQIKALEDEMGTPLFDRTGKKISLTAAGSVLEAHAAAVFNTLRSAKEQIDELHQGERGTLAIGSLPGELNHLVSSLLVPFNKRFPNMKLKIVAADNLAERVLGGELDAAVSLLSVDDARLETIPLYEERFYLTVPENHPLAQRESIGFDEVRKLPAILFPQSHKCRQLVDAACGTSGFRLEPFIETNAIDSIFNLVKSGAGVSILSESLIRLTNDDRIAAIPIVRPVLSRQVVIIHIRGKFLSNPIRVYLSMLQQFAQEKILGGQASGM